ncbi:MAG: oligoribonuclease [Candidatus Dependentiae bacterium]|nr:oligoribonuclease [Candidatus Dependentiae bacterium]
MASDKNLVWIDLEMTGLRPEIDVIVEIATIITDDQLNIIAEGPSLVIHQPEEKLAAMDEFVVKMHTKSGLIAKIRESAVSPEQAEQETLAFIMEHCNKGKALMAGNSIWQDRAFLYVHMPSILAFLDYRLIDVSSVKKLVQYWYPKNPNLQFKKPDNHRALEDVQQSIEELKHYRKHFFINEN